MRGLDYYTRTVFEIYPAGQSGSQDALGAGGRYDGLVEQLGGKSTPAVGFALGFERVLNYLELKQTQTVRKGVFFAPLGNEAYIKSVDLVHELRDAVTKPIPIISAGNPDQSLKSLIRAADNGSYEYCVIIGDNELKKNQLILKYLNKSQVQETLPLATFIETMKQKINYEEK